MRLQRTCLCTQPCTGTGSKGLAVAQCVLLLQVDWLGLNLRGDSWCLVLNASKSNCLPCDECCSQDYDPQHYQPGGPSEERAPALCAAATLLLAVLLLCLLSC